MKRRNKLFLIISNLIIFGFVIALVKNEFSAVGLEREEMRESLIAIIVSLLILEVFLFYVITNNGDLFEKDMSKELEKEKHGRMISYIMEQAQIQMDRSVPPPTISEELKRSRVISQQTKMYVWRRDGGKCVECGSNQNLEYDHIIPFSKGGSNTDRNIQLLCESCNRKKSHKIQ